MMTRLWQELHLPHIHLASFLLRLGLGAIFFFHGYMKLSVREGAGWSGDLLPEASERVVAWGETAGGAALFVGLLSRLAAAGLIAVAVGAIALTSGKHGFVNLDYIHPNRFSVPVGAEYHVALIVMCLAVIALGSGKVSLDHLIFGRRRAAAAASVAVAPA